MDPIIYGLIPLICGAIAGFSYARYERIIKNRVNDKFNTNRAKEIIKKDRDEVSSSKKNYKKLK